MWKTTNYKGETVTWYSEEEYNELLVKIKEKEDERNNTRNSDVSNNVNQSTVGS